MRLRAPFLFRDQDQSPAHGGRGVRGVRLVAGQAHILPLRGRELFRVVHSSLRSPCLFPRMFTQFLARVCAFKSP